MSAETDFDSFVSRASSAQIHLKLEEAPDPSARRPDALFHLPLLALTVLAIVSSSREGVPTSEIGTWVALTIQRAFTGLDLSPQRLRYSVVLRKRCADALVFLEGASLTEVTRGSIRVVKSTQEGRKVVRKAAAETESESGVLVRGLIRSFIAVSKTGRELL